MRINEFSQRRFDQTQSRQATRRVDTYQRLAQQVDGSPDASSYGANTRGAERLSQGTWDRSWIQAPKQKAGGDRSSGPGSDSTQNLKNKAVELLGAKSGELYQGFATNFANTINDQEMAIAVFDFVNSQTKEKGNDQYPNVSKATLRHRKITMKDAILAKYPNVSDLNQKAGTSS